MVDKLNIYQKLVEVRKALGKVSKDTEGYGFEYVSGSQILGKIKETMDTLGILLEPHLIDGSVREVTSVNAKGKSIINYIVTSQMKMIWINADDPKDRSVVDWYMVGEQTDPSQAFGSGLTYAERYFILKYFNAETDADDPDKNEGKGKQIEEPDPFSGEQNDYTDDIGKDKLVTQAQIEKMMTMVGKAGIDPKKFDAKIKKDLKIESKNQMTMGQINPIFDYLDKRIMDKKANENK